MKELLMILTTLAIEESVQLVNFFKTSSELGFQELKELLKKE